jgi:hypothetical protein
MAGLAEFLFGSGDKIKQLPTMTGEQQGLLSSLLQQLGILGSPGGSYQGAQNYLSSLFAPDSDVYNTFEAPYYRQFNEQTIPQLAERFAGLGAMGGALSSSGFGQALGAAGAGLQENLAALRGQLQQNAVGQSFGQYNQLANMGLNAQPFAYHNRRGSTGFVPTALGNALGQYLGAGIGNTMFGGK